MIELSEDGTVKGEPFHFSGKDYKGGYPHSQNGESFASYRKLVEEYIDKGFSISDLNQKDWEYYCKGSGAYEGTDSNELIP